MLLRLACGVGRFFKFPRRKNLRSVGGIERELSVGEEKIKKERESILSEGEKCTLGRNTDGTIVLQGLHVNTLELLSDKKYQQQLSQLQSTSGKSLKVPLGLLGIVELPR